MTDPLRAALLDTAREHPYSGIRGVCACGWRGGAARHIEHIVERQADALVALAADTAPLDGQCWFCKQAFVVDALIAGYDTWDEQRLACLACNERMDGNWRPRP